jgi:hypothetical protein
MGDYKLQERRREADHFNHYSPPRRSAHQRYPREPSSSKSRSRSGSISHSSSRSRSRSIASSRSASEREDVPGEETQETPSDSDRVDKTGWGSKNWSGNSGQSTHLPREKPTSGIAKTEIGNEAAIKDISSASSASTPVVAQSTSPKVKVTEVLLPVSELPITPIHDDSIHQRVPLVPAPGLEDVINEKPELSNRESQRSADEPPRTLEILPTTLRPLPSLSPTEPPASSNVGVLSTTRTNLESLRLGVPSEKHLHIQNSQYFSQITHTVLLIRGSFTYPYSISVDLIYSAK